MWIGGLDGHLHFIVHILALYLIEGHHSIICIQLEGNGEMVRVVLG